jgi:hypothetical protein
VSTVRHRGRGSRPAAQLTLELPTAAGFTNTTVSGDFVVSPSARHHCGGLGHRDFRCYRRRRTPAFPLKSSSGPTPQFPLFWSPRLRRSPRSAPSSSRNR